MTGLDQTVERTAANKAPSGTRLRNKGRGATLGVGVLLCCLGHPGTSWAAPTDAEDVLPLRSGELRVLLSARSGHLAGLADTTGTTYLTQSADGYDLEGRTSAEAEDAVLSRTAMPDRVRFECRNATLGLSIRKEYRLNGPVLEKTLQVLSDRPDKQLLRVTAETRVARKLFDAGYYYIPTEDGSKVWTVPYIAGPSIAAPATWPVEGANGFIYYFPKLDRVLFHSIRTVNGGCVHICPMLGVESRLVPGGASLGLGQAFVSATAPLTLVSEYVLLEGDPSAYHRYVLSQPPYSEFRDVKLPTWFKNARMFLSDGAAGTGYGLMGDRNGPAADVLSFMRLLRNDENVMIFFNHWSTSGDYPYSGTFRYYTYSTNGWSQPTPVEDLRENLRYLKSLSPRIKVGGYVFLSPMESSTPYLTHPDWLVYDKSGALALGGDGIGKAGVPDFSTPYRDYVLDQMEHMITDTGFDWLHLDYGPFETVNWKTRNVCQNADASAMYARLARICESHDAALIENGAPSVSLWAHGSYFEVQQPDRWERKDWRVLAIPGYLAALYRTNRPGTWVCNCYGTTDMWGVRSAFAGMRGWIRNASNWWRNIAHSLAHEKVIDELLETTAGPAVIHPSWWRLETDTLETLALAKGNDWIIPLLLHGDKARAEKIWARTSELGLTNGNYTFAFDLRLSSSAPLDMYTPVPAREAYMELLGFEALRSVGRTYTHRLSLVPLRNYYHVITQVPAWVYTYNGQRAAFLLPNNRGMTIAGALPVGARSYQLAIENRNQAGEVLAYVPAAWDRVAVSLNGSPVATAAARLDVLGHTCVRVRVPTGRSEVTVAQASAGDAAVRDRDAYEDPWEEVWLESAERVLYSGLQHRAFSEDGKSCLALRSAAGGGTAAFPVAGRLPADGFDIKMKGQGTGARLTVTLNAGDAWTYEISDDFTGWRQFRVDRTQMRTTGKDRKWEGVAAMVLEVRPAPGTEIVVADPVLLPGSADASSAPKTRKRIRVCRTKTPPVIDGHATDACWSNCTEVSDFHQLSGAPTDSQTLVKLCYDTENLYVFFNNTEPIEKLAAPGNRDDQIWTTDHVELELDPFRDGAHWFHLLVDTAGTIEDMENTAMGRNPAWNGDFEVKTALNWKAAWTAEYRVPFRILGKAPAPGDVWGINFARLDASTEWSAWASGELLDPAGFGEVLFAGEPGAGTPGAGHRPQAGDVLFHCSFDGTLKPDVGTGPAAAGPEPAQYVAGRKRQALITSHTRHVTYPVEGNVNPVEGTIRLWVRPLDWNRRDSGFHHFLALPGDEQAIANNQFMLILYRFQNWDSITAYTVRQKGKADILNVDLDDSWATGKQWHQIAFAWDARGASLHVDDHPPAGLENQAEAPTSFWGKSFSLGGPYFVANPTQTAIADLTVYDHRLTATEIRDLYRKERRR